MILQGSFTFWTIIYILIATIFLWLALWLATRIIVSKDFGNRKKIMLLLTALLMVLLVPIVTGAIITVIGLPGELMVMIRGLIDNGGHNYVSGMAPIIAFLIFLIILKFLVGMEWRHTIWVGLIGIFLLYLFYSLVPELDFMGAMGYT
ncbi:hypothetical protein NEF87_002115 [Candidatus Lokiarchaeum ossiferum]|uniref:Uncharacterized protein n=1 Tax=Candidatus Lokiarchaeum ossiferum TaxID=2951803 RepID=A0ABY6HR06_9ARCH|nr:hypothetical protein NEF87_002115 [Candidatus Lokiarchaeum sp. B-35]